MALYGRSRSPGHGADRGAAGHDDPDAERRRRRCLRVELLVNDFVTPWLAVGGNYTAIKKTIRDTLQPNLRPTGVPAHKAFLFATWSPLDKLAITPSLDIAGDRWSDVNPASAFPYVRTGAYTLFNLSAQYTLARNVDVVFGLKNLNDDSYSLAWGFPQPGRTYYVKTRVGL
jgi:iron complex outermembrane recepter protein